MIKQQSSEMPGWSPRTGQENKASSKKAQYSSHNDGSLTKNPAASEHINTFNSMLEDTSLTASRITSLERDIERRQETYVARERAYKARIDELEDEIRALKANKTSWMESDGKISKLRQMQSQILSNIELVQDRTSNILQEQERDLLKAFRARLYDVQTELEKEKSKKDDGAGAWIDRCNTLTSELEWARSVADRLERVNQSLMQDNSRLKSEYSSQEEDRNFIITQLVTVKKENARLRAEYTALEGELLEMRAKMDKMYDEAPKPQGVFGMRLNANQAAAKAESEEKYKDINLRLKRLLADERKSLQTLRQTYSAELKTRSDLELLLRQCVEDVRKEIALRKIEPGIQPGLDALRLYSKTPGTVKVEEFTREDRERTLELLLSQERVVTLLYAKTFPINGKMFKATSTDLVNKNATNTESLLNQSTSHDSLDEIITDGLQMSRPQSSKILGTPGERDRARDKLPLIQQNMSILGASVLRPSSTGAVLASD